MSWFPLGPDFTFRPCYPDYLRMSRRNEYGAQAMIGVIAIDPSNVQTIYVASSPWTGGASAFRSDDAGRTWASIIDDIAPTLPATSAPTAIAVNPSNSQIVYMGWSDGTFYVSEKQGDPHWWNNPTVIAAGASITTIIVDPTTAGTANVTLYAGTSAGLFISVNSGGTWTNVTVDQHGTQYVDRMGGVAIVDSLVADFSGATPNFYAGLRDNGIVYSNDPLTSGWTNLNAQNIGLYDVASNPYTVAVQIALCPQVPNRLYAYFLDPLTTPGNLGIYTTSAPTAAWTQVNCPTFPDGYTQGMYTFNLAVCPNSPGDGVNDILLFGTSSLNRSTDGGQTWTDVASQVEMHADYHALAFAPQAGTSIPAVYIGSDGGIAVSTALADPSVALTMPATGYDDGAAYDGTTWLAQSLDHSLRASALLSYASHPQISALGYISCGDTGVAGNTGGLVWRCLDMADAFGILASPGANGVSVWCDTGLNSGWPPYIVEVITDTGAFDSTNMYPQFGAGYIMRTSQHFIHDNNGLCLGGFQARFDVGTLETTFATPGTQTVSPSSMQYVTVGAMLVIDPTGFADVVQVTAVDPTANPPTFQATFKYAHSAGVDIQYQPAFVGRLDENGTLTQISQDLQNLLPTALAAAPRNPNILVCAVADVNGHNAGVFQTTTGATANASTVWTQATANVPFSSTSSIELPSFAGLPPQFTSPISSVAIDVAGTIYVLLGHRSQADSTPLYTVAGGTWTATIPSGLPAGTLFGPCVADPIAAGLLYAAIDGQVFSITVSATRTATWQNITNDLPGPSIYDLWVANIGTQAQPKVILRCAVAGRGIYECDVTAGATEPAVALYMRAHFMDQSWLSVVADGVTNPYSPTETLYHYESADIKVDPQQSGGGSTFYTTDPEDPLPISYTTFGQLSANASNLPTQDQANVHVQVNNRSTTAQEVWVWAIYCAGAAGVASLSASQSLNNAFPFWDQFLNDGTIVPGLPADSPWQSLGAPVKLTGVDASNPQVASWNWQIPNAVSGNHHCMVAFVNCANAPLSETIYDVDTIVVTNRQVSQKNLTVLPGAPPPPDPPAPPEPMRRRPIKVSIIFNNPSVQRRITDLHFDFQATSERLRARVLLPEVTLERPLETSLRHFSLAGRTEAEPAHVRHVLTASGGRRAIVEGVHLPPFGAHTVDIELSADDEHAFGRDNRFHVQQVVDGRVVGGNLIIVQGAAKKTARFNPEAPDGPTGEAPPPRLAPWIQYHVAVRAHALGRSTSPRQRKER